MKKYKSCKSCLKSIEINISDFMTTIVEDNEVATLTGSCRNILAEKGKKEYDDYKVNNLPAVTPAADFLGKRVKDEPHTLTGIIMLDFDHTNEKTKDIIVTLREQRNVMMAMVSLSGMGVHALVRCNGLTDANYSDVYGIVARYYSVLVGFNYDRACSDYSRCMILNHDPDAYFNLDAEALDAEKLLENERRLNQFKMENSNLSLTAYLDKVQQTMSMLKGMRHTNSVSLAGCLNQAGFDKDEAADECVRRFEEPDFDEKEIRRIFDSVYSLYKDQFGTKKREDVDNWTVGHPMLNSEVMEDSELDEEDYFEQVRCNQPCVAEFRDHLPNLIKDMINPEEENCIQWVQFIAAITAFSGMPIHTVFMEMRKSTLSISTLVVGESGSGKSYIKEAQELIQMFTNYVEKDYHQTVVLPAKKELMEWEQAQKSAGKGDEDVTLGDKPVVPEELNLITSFTTSCEGLVSRLAKNGILTTFNYTDEIGEGASTGRRDYGIKNDQRCKLLEGETVSTDYKSSGCIRVDAPRYLELAAGTPASVQRFLGNREDGLTARYLYVRLPKIQQYRRLSEATVADREKHEEALRCRIETFTNICLKKHVEVQFPQPVKDIIEDEVERLRNLYLKYDNNADVSFCNRLRKKAMKICALFTFMHHYDASTLIGGDDDQHMCSLNCEEATALLVTSLLPYLTYTASRITAPLKAGKVQKLSQFDIDDRKLFELMPDSFTTSQLNATARMLNLGKKTAQRHRERWQDLGIIKRIKQGSYEKIYLSQNRA